MYQTLLYKFDTFIILSVKHVSTTLYVNVKPMLNIRFRILVCLFKIGQGNYLMLILNST